MQGEKESLVDEKAWEEFKKAKLSGLAEAMEKGEVDEGILPLLNIINQKPDFVTSSSCYGRILLLSGKNKGEAKHYAKWHYTPSLQELLESVDSFSGDLLWLKVEPFILHVFARNWERAKDFMAVTLKAGVKRGGIKYCKRFCIIEIQGTSYLSLPLSYCKCDWGKLYPLIKEMMEDNERRLRKLERELLTL